MDSLLELFCDVDDFCQKFEPVWIKRLMANGECQRQKAFAWLSLTYLFAALIRTDVINEKGSPGHGCKFHDPF